MTTRIANYPSSTRTKKSQLTMECAYIRRGMAYVHISSRDGWIISEQEECGDRKDGRLGWQKAIACAVLKVLQKIPEWNFEKLEVSDCRAEFQENRKVRSIGSVCFGSGSGLCPGDSQKYFGGPASYARMLVDAANCYLEANPYSSQAF